MTEYMRSQTELESAIFAKKRLLDVSEVLVVQY